MISSMAVSFRFSGAAVDVALSLVSDGLLLEDFLANAANPPPFFNPPIMVIFVLVVPLPADVLFDAVVGVDDDLANKLSLIGC